MGRETWSNVLALYWSRFVDCEKRSTTLMPILHDVASNYKNPKILDLAAGIGCESINLVSLGYKVISNEIEPALREIALKNSIDSGINLQLSSANWLNLSDRFQCGYFDVVFLIGNSFCLLNSRKEMKKAAFQFFNICKSGGTFIIDERNFVRILRYPNNYLSRKNAFHRKVIYCGKTVTGRPISITNRKIKFGYYIDDSEKEIGILNMIPFKQNELVKLFKSVGFEHTKTMCDLKNQKQLDCDFLTHFFRKPN